MPYVMVFGSRAEECFFEGVHWHLVTGYHRRCMLASATGRAWDRKVPDRPYSYRIARRYWKLVMLSARRDGVNVACNILLEAMGVTVS